jgi:preprotein translocase subunit SecG
MYIAVVIVHVIVSLFLIIVVLLQSGKAADLAGAFGGLGSQTVFGPRGSATVLTRATSVSAVLFMVTSLTLSVMSTGAVGAPPGSNILDEISAPASSAPAKAPEKAPDAGKAATPGTFEVIPQIQGGPAEANPVAPAPAK